MIVLRIIGGLVIALIFVVLRVCKALRGELNRIKSELKFIAKSTQSFHWCSIMLMSSSYTFLDRTKLDYQWRRMAYCMAMT